MASQSIQLNDRHPLHFHFISEMLDLKVEFGNALNNKATPASVMLGLNQVSYQTILNAALGAGINCLRLTYCDAGMIAEVPPQSADGSNFSINTTENSSDP